MKYGYYVSAFCGLLLAITLLALIFNEKFRKDVMGGQGTAKILGILSVEGVVIVLLCGMFLAGLLYPVIKEPSSGEEVENFIKSLPLNETNADEVRTRIQQIIRDLDIAEKRIEELKAEERFPLEDLPTKLRMLDPQDPVSEELRKIAVENEGPWSPYSTSREILVSVPGDIDEGNANGCPVDRDKSLELISNYKRDGKVLRGQSNVTVRVTKLMFSSSDCRKITGQDLQLNCKDAIRLFSEEVLGCDEADNPLWRVEDRRLPAFAVAVI